MKSERLLRVENVFEIEHLGVIVTPKIPVSQFHGEAVRRSVLLEKPDGTSTRAEAEFTIPHVTPPPVEIFFLCRLVGLRKEDVPVGTEVWATA